MDDYLHYIETTPELNELRRYWSAQGYLFQVEVEDRPVTFDRKLTITMTRADARDQSVIAVSDGAHPFPYIQFTLDRLAVRMSAVPASRENRRGVLLYLVKMARRAVA